MGADPVAEAALAELLADVLGDAEFWREYRVAADASVPSRVLAQRAVDLYGLLLTFIEENLRLDPDAPVVRAIAAGREIADWGVLASYSRAQVGERIPPRPAFEWLIRVEGVDRWARELGYDLPIAEDAELPNHAWPTAASDHTEPELTDLVEAWTVVSGHYSQFLSWLEEPNWRRAWESPKASTREAVERWREGVAEIIDGVRPWLALTRRMVEPEPQAVGGATLWMAEGLFVAGWQWPEDGVMLPPPSLLSEMLRETDSLDWLTEQGAELPDWLA